MKDMAYYTERLMCSQGDRESCLKLIEKLYGLAEESRKSGLLALEKEIKQQKDAFLAEGLLLLISGESRESLEEFLERMLMAGNYWGKAFLEKALMLEGLKMIHRGENQRDMARILLSMLGASCYEAYGGEDL